MNSIRTAVTRRIRTTVPVAVAAAAVTGLVWGAASGPTSAGRTAVDTSLVQLADSDPLTGAGSGVRPLPAWMPQELRADLRELRSMEPEQRREGAARIWRDALAGEYGARVRIRAVEARHRFRTLPEELRDDLKELRGLDGEELRDALRVIRGNALDGEYGDQVRRRAERRAGLWQQN